MAVIGVNALSFNVFAPKDSIFGSGELGKGGPMEDIGEQSGAFLSFPPTVLANEDAAKNRTFFAVGNDAVLGSALISDEVVKFKKTLTKYKAQKGDTFSKIAKRFNITQDTIRLANPRIKTVKIGAEFLILPVSGSLYEVQPNDSLESIVNRFKVNENDVKKYNPDYKEIFESTSGSLILPNIKLTSEMVKSQLPELKGFFTLPVQGWNWGELHTYNAVDIANKCDAPVITAAEGLVILDEKLGSGENGWNNGYGLFVLVEHSNGVKTRYAHLSQTSVKIGDYVKEGNQVGLIGNTGKSHGPTGCHLHFEVIGAKNPFVKK